MTIDSKIEMFTHKNGNYLLRIETKDDLEFLANYSVQFVNVCTHKMTFIFSVYLKLFSFSRTFTFFVKFVHENFLTRFSSFPYKFVFLTS